MRGNLAYRVFWHSRGKLNLLLLDEVVRFATGIDLEHPLPMASVYIIYHSGYGHTKLQAEAVHRGAASVPAVHAHLITTAEATSKLDELDGADAIIFGCPTYMGNMSAEMKKFIEVAATKWFTLAWKDKIAGSESRK